MQDEQKEKIIEAEPVQEPKVEKKVAAREVYNQTNNIVKVAIVGIIGMFSVCAATAINTVIGAVIALLFIAYVSVQLLLSMRLSKSLEVAYNLKG